MDSQYDLNELYDEDDPFKPLKNIKETYGTLYKLSDEALNVLNKHLLLSYTTNKEREETMKVSGEAEHKVNEVQLKRFKDLITINWANDLKYLRKAWYSGETSGEPEIAGKDEMPGYWSARAEAWCKDFLLGKIFGDRRSGSITVRADIEASDNLEIQRLEMIRKAFINKFGKDNKVVKFIEEREEFYHNAIQHSLKATMIGKELYDSNPMFAQILFELPYDLAQGLAAGTIKTIVGTIAAKVGGLNAKKFFRSTKVKKLLKASERKIIKNEAKIAKLNKTLKEVKDTSKATKI